MQTDKPLVSIIIPIYNRANYLEKAIESVLKQTYENIEIIVSDNASTDNTMEVMQKYKDNPKIKYFRNKKNIGMAPNWKKALYEYAKGEFAMILSDDDYLIDHNYIKEAVKSINKCNSKLAFSNCLQVFEKGGRIVKEELIEYKLAECNSGEDLFFLWRKNNNGKPFMILLQTVIFDRKIATDEFEAFSNPIISTDFQLWLSFFAKRYSASFINLTGAAYRIHSRSEAVRNRVSFKGWLDNFSCYTIPEQIAIKNFGKNKTVKHVNWMIRESFKDLPGNIINFKNYREFKRELDNYPRLKKEFYKALIFYPKALLKLILSSNENFYSAVRKLYWKYIKKDELFLKEE